MDQQQWGEAWKDSSHQISSQQSLFCTAQGVQLIEGQGSRSRLFPQIAATCRSTRAKRSITRRRSKAESSPSALHFRQVRPRQFRLLIDPLESVKADLLVAGASSLLLSGHENKSCRETTTLLQPICCSSTLSTLGCPLWISTAAEFRGHSPCGSIVTTQIKIHRRRRPRHVTCVSCDHPRRRGSSAVAHQ